MMRDDVVGFVKFTGGLVVVAAVTVLTVTVPIVVLWAVVRIVRHAWMGE